MNFFHLKYFFLIVFLFGLTKKYAVAKESDSLKVALVLSGGGAKGFAHIGVLKILEEEGIPIDIIVGTSIGSIVGGLYSIGYSADEIESMAKTEDWDRLLSNDIGRKSLSQNVKNEKQSFIASVPMNDQYKPVVPHGFINGQNIINLFCKLTSDIPADADFLQFPISFACIGTNLANGDEIVIDHGFLPTAIYSSMAIPGVFQPLKHNGLLMLDGGLVNNFPTDVAKRMGADIIIGVDIRNDLHGPEEIVTMEHLMDQLINFYALGKDSVNKSLCDILIRPNIQGYNAYSFSTSAVDTLVQRGILSARTKIDEMEDLKANYHLRARRPVERHSLSDSVRIEKLTISGSYSMNDKLILNNLDLTIPGTSSFGQIKNSVDELYGLGYFKRVYYTLSEADKKGETLNLILEEQPSKNINVGMRVNTTDAVSILLNFTQKDYRRFIGLFSVTADISSNPGLSVQSELSKGKLPVFGIQLEGKYHNYDVYYGKQESYTTGLIFGRAGIYTYKNLKNTATFGLSLKEEYFKGEVFNLPNDSMVDLYDDQTAITSLLTYLSVDNLDDYYFPTQGTELYLEFSLSSDEKFNTIDPIVLLKNRNTIALYDKSAVLLNFYGRALFAGNVYQFRQTFAGGPDYGTYFTHHFPFYGLPSVTLHDNFTFIGLIGFRINIAKKHYVSLLGNCLVDNNDILSLEDYQRTLGTALSYSFNSRFGPLDLTIGYSDGYEKLTFSANVGYWF
ncbi:MAG: patatin-like phospholipase family protein [Bacteroidales bacterium]